ncbi:MAG TPA: glycosyltransferase [Acidimicrobiia bacterium]|nr:glycosyltransferase [Acidimicrobiia bacterium]
MASSTAAPTRPRVLWLIKGLGPGGAERLLVEHAAIGDHAALDYDVAYLLPWKDQLVPDLEALGVTTHCLEVRSAADPRGMLRLRRLVRSLGVDVVHVHSPAVAAAARVALRGLHPRPAFVSTEHNRWASHRRLTRLANRATIGLDDATVAVSEAVRSSMGDHGDRATVVRHGIDLDRVRAHAASRDAVREELGVADDEALLVTVANLRANKGYPFLLAAARAVLDHGRRVRFVAAGQGPLEGELRALHDRLELGDGFRLLGYVPDAARLTAGADLFVLASLHEGLPVAVMEALALGVPVVATDVGGLPELVEPDVSGLLVPSRDAAALAAAIETALEPSNHSRLAAGARRRGDAVAATDAVANLDRLYLELAAARRG